MKTGLIKREEKENDMKVQKLGNTGAVVNFTDAEVEVLKTARRAIKKASIASDLDSTRDAHDTRTVNGVLMLLGRIFDEDRDSVEENFSAA